MVPDHKEKGAAPSRDGFSMIALLLKSQITNLAATDTLNRHANVPSQLPPGSDAQLKPKQT